MTATCRCLSALLLSGFLLVIPSSRADGQSNAEKKMPNREPRWDPPDVEGRLKPMRSASPCELSAVLEQAGARANELVGNLENFTAQERIAYRSLGLSGNRLASGAGTFDYIVAFEQGLGGRTVQESRRAERGSQEFPVSSQDVGLPDLALIFLPEFHGDYEMRCEGEAEWSRQPTWVVHFQQRTDKPAHTVSFTTDRGVYPAKLRGRAWIAADSGEVVHLETKLMEGVPAMNVVEWYLSIDYGPVQFHKRNVRIWLPQAADAYCNYGDHRTIIYHTFSDFRLFSVDTNAVTEKPKEP
jgi:hypothetical protein